MIEDADEDGSGSINFPEFVGLMMKKQEGSISKDEIKQVRLMRMQFYERIM
jgi:Ca2+-binding EF-hand superfamily protein